MCQAIQEIRIESEQIGEEKGRRIGEEKGRRIGEEKGRLEQAKETARSLYKLGIDIEIIAQGVNYPVETVKGWINPSF